MNSHFTTETRSTRRKAFGIDFGRATNVIDSESLHMQGNDPSVFLSALRASVVEWF